MYNQANSPFNCVHADPCDSCTLRATCSSSDSCAAADSCSVQGKRPTLNLKPVNKKYWLKALLNQEMIVVPRVAGTRLAGPLRELDQALDGILSKEIAAHNFHGKLGERLTVEVKRPDISLQRVLFAGLGDPENTQRFNLCGLVGLALEAADQHGAKTVALPFFPYALETGLISLKGASFILGCRIHNAPSSRDTSVEKFEILASPQAMRHIEQGTESYRQLCFHCSDPRLPLFEG